MKISENKSKLAVIAAAPLMAVALALVAGTLTQEAVAAPTQLHQFAVGGFTTLFTQSHVAFAAQIVVKNFTASYSGHVVQEDATGATRHGPVDYCVYVSGSQAVVVWTVSKSDIDPFEVGTQRSFVVIDGGQPSGPDYYADRGNNTNCYPDGSESYQPLFSGNIVVKTQ